MALISYLSGSKPADELTGKIKETAKLSTDVNNYYQSQVAPVSAAEDSIKLSATKPKLEEFKGRLNSLSALSGNLGLATLWKSYSSSIEKLDVEEAKKLLKTEMHITT